MKPCRALCRGRDPRGARARGGRAGRREVASLRPCLDHCIALQSRRAPGRAKLLAFCDVRCCDSLLHGAGPSRRRCCAARRATSERRCPPISTRTWGARRSAPPSSSASPRSTTASCLERSCAHTHFILLQTPSLSLRLDFFGRRRRSPPVPRLSPFSPRQPGEKREWEDWEYSYVPLMTSAFIIYGVAFAYRCV